MSVVRYRRLPIEVDTIEWTGTNLDELIAFTGGDFLLTTDGEFDDPDITAKVYDSLHDTWIGVKPGQRVLHGAKGETYPIDADALAETYELASVDRPGPHDACRTEVFNEAIAALQGLHDLNPAGRRAPQMAFSIGVLMGARDFPAEKSSREADATPDFFQPGHTYTREHHGRAIEFRVTGIDTSPDGEQRLARGWRTDDRSDWEPSDSDDLTGWTDVTETEGR